MTAMGVKVGKATTATQKMILKAVTEGIPESYEPTIAFCFGSKRIVKKLKDIHELYKKENK